MEESFQRVTLSFYRYVIVEDPQALRDQLWREWSAMQVFGRIYVAKEGINAQLSLPEHYFQAFRMRVDEHEQLKDVPFKIAVEDDARLNDKVGQGKSFFRLTIKVRSKIVADGLDDNAFDVTNVGNHLTAIEFNDAMENPETIVVDMRNHYESEVGHFTNAILPQSESFCEELPIVLDQQGKDKKILMYCTGGFAAKSKCFLKHHGFKDVNQLYGVSSVCSTNQATEYSVKIYRKNFVLMNSWANVLLMM